MQQTATDITVFDTQPGAAIDEAIDTAAVVAAFRQTGCVLFRGYSVDVDRFARLTQRFSSDFRSHGVANRPAVGDDKYLILADPGTKALHLHAELSYLPELPEVLWFCCVSPPGDDGDTLVCDGARLWSAFDTPMRQAFLDKKIRYSAVWPRETWQRYFEVETASQLTARLAPLASVTFRLNAGDRLSFKYVTPAVRAHRDTGDACFVNAVLHWGLDGLHDFLSFEDGTPISPSLLAAVQERADATTSAVAWRRGDVVMIDNTRVMHGRRAFSDPMRKLHVRMGRSLSIS